MKLYVATVRMSVANRVEYERTIDDMTKEIKLAFPKYIRDKIEAVRRKYKNQLYDNTVNFYGLHLVDDEMKQRVKEIVEEADRELKEIDASLSAKVVFIPISEKEVEEAELYNKILYAIQYQILKEVHQRVKDLKSPTLRGTSRKAIKEMLEDMRKLNIINDDRIDLLIRKIEQMLTMKTEEIKKTIMEELEYIEKELMAL